MNHISSVRAEQTHALKCALAAEILRSCGTLRLQVAGWSMMPAVRPGDKLIVEGAKPEMIVEGDIVLFGREERLFVHRVVRKSDASAIMTRGDAMPAPDPVLQTKEILGRICHVERDREMIVPRRTRTLTERAIALLLRNSQFAARAIAGLHSRFQSRESNHLDRIIPCQS